MWQPCNRHHGPLHPGLYCGNTTLPIELLERKEKKIRSCSNFNTNRFLPELQEIEWSNLPANDANKSFTTLYKKINSLVNKHALMKTVSKRREKILSKPWFTKRIRTSIRIEK